MRARRGCAQRDLLIARRRAATRHRSRRGRRSPGTIGGWCIWGPGDAFGRNIPRAIRSGRFAFIARGDYPYSTCHVDNVAEALIRALDGGEGGKAYFIRDPDNTTFRAFIDGLATLQGLSIAKLRSVPFGTAFLMGRVMEIGARLRGSDRDPDLSRTMVRLIGREFTIDDSAARRDLGYASAVSRREGMAS